MEQGVVDPRRSQVNKPVHKFAQEICEELARLYEQIPGYHS